MHKAVEEVELFMTFFTDKGRINAQGVRVTDVAMLQYINGQIAGATAWAGNSWYNYLQNGLQGFRVFFDSIAGAPGAIVLDLMSGGYIYHKPTEITDFNWKPWVTWDAKLKKVIDQSVPLATDRPVKMIAMTAANDNTTGNPTGGGASCFITVATMLEWIPNAKSYPKMKSMYTRENCADGIDIMGDMPDFTANDAHWDQFLNIASKVAKWGAPVWHAALNSGVNKLSEMFPKLAGVFKAGGGLAHKGVDMLGGKRRR
jgi:hypothetical protein